MMLQGKGTIAMVALLVLAAFAGCIGTDEPASDNETNATDDELATQNTSSDEESTFSAPTNDSGNQTDGPDEAEEKNQTDEETTAPGNATLDAEPTQGPAALSVNFTLNGTQRSSATWTLSFGDGAETDGYSTQFPAVVEHAYSSAGNYTATLTVSYSEDTTRNATAQVNVTPPPSDDTPSGVIAEGTILIGNPTSADLGGLSEGGTAPEGVDGIRAELGEPYWGLPVTAEGASEGPYSLDVWFYDASDTLLSGNCATEDVDETCEVPEGAAYAWIDLWLGANVDVTFRTQCFPFAFEGFTIWYK